MTTPAPSPCCPCPPPGSAAGFLLCDCPTVGDCTQFIRVFTTGGGFVDTTLDRLPYAPTGTVGSCCGNQDDTGACASPTTPVAVAHLCLADGTPIVVVVQRDCDGTVSAPGWVNLATGVFTAGLVPADAAPCDATVATAGSTGRLALCDVHADGTVVGFLRAIDGDGQVTDTTIAGLPYVPTGTVGLCDAVTAATAATDHVALCDCPPVGACVGFLRSIAADGTITDTTVAGLPYVPTGTVGLCDAATAGTPPCESLTTPISTTGLCLADGTPIATVSQRDCDGVITQPGWINLTNGAFTLGMPPVGTRACGVSQSIQVSGVFCDINPVDGTVFALVLVEYHYAPDGSIDSVRIVLAADGTTHVLQGVLSICPDSGAEMDVETQLLCLVDAGGVLISQVIAEFGYTNNTGARLFLRFTDPTTGAVIAPPLGATVQDCAGVVGVGVDVENQLLCLVDAGGVLISQVVAEYGYDAATGDRTFARYTDPTTGADVVPPVGATVQECTVAGRADVEIVKMCDLDGIGLNRRFFRHYVYNPDGTVASTFDTDWDGTPYTPTGTQQLPCDQTLVNTTTQILCDDNGPFVRVYQLRIDAPTPPGGQNAGSYNVTIAGAPYLPVGTVRVCGTDPVAAPSLVSQARVFTDAGPAWTPADVVGIATSVSATGLAGTWSVTDANGTVTAGLPAGLTLTWSAQDANTLVPPQSISAEVGGRVVANWTDRT